MTAWPIAVALMSEFLNGVDLSSLFQEKGYQESRGSLRDMARGHETTRKWMCRRQLFYFLSLVVFSPRACVVVVAERAVLEDL